MRIGVSSVLVDLGAKKPLVIVPVRVDGHGPFLFAVDTLEIGSLCLSGLTLVVSDFFRTLSEAVGTEIEGALGWNVLQQFRVTFDYPAGRLGFAS